MIDIELELKFNTRQYKRFLKRLKDFCMIISTVGIHESEGKKSVVRRYTKAKASGGTTSAKAGIRHKMTLAKLAYQNEFGADIPIRAKYIRKKSNKKEVIHTKTKRYTIKTRTMYSELRNAKEQGYVLFDKNGKGVLYFRPGSIIHIPQRSFLRKTVRDIDDKTRTVVSNILKRVIADRTMTPLQGMRAISSIVVYRVRYNIRKSKRNNKYTIQAKGFDKPLTDEQDRIFKAIKYKLYKNPYSLGSKGRVQYLKQFEKHIDKLYKNAQKYEDLGVEITRKTKVFTYKRFNPNAKGYIGSLSDSGLNSYINTLPDLAQS